MEIVFYIFLTLHIIGGSIGLFTGSWNLVRKKGDKSHKLTGKFFSYSMLTAGVSSLVLSVLHPNYFLFIVGFFTIYLVGTGHRYIYLKMLGKDQKPAIMDWAITTGMLVSGIVLMGFGIIHLLSKNYFGIVFMVFGILGLRLVITDFYNYQGKPKAKNYWLLAHLQRMIGGYIASATAFLVVNAKYSPVNMPSVVFWLLPTIILVPVIIKFTRRYEVKTSDSA